MKPLIRFNMPGLLANESELANDNESGPPPSTHIPPDATLRLTPAVSAVTPLSSITGTTGNDIYSDYGGELGFSLVKDLANSTGTGYSFTTTGPKQ